MRHSIAILLLLASTAAGFAAPPLGVKVRDVDLQHFPQVKVTFSMESPVAMDVRHLTAEDIEVVEEEVPVRHLSIQPAGPQLSLALVLDDSGSQDHTLGHLKRAVNRLVGLLGPHDQAAVVSFARGTEVLSPLTADKHRLQDAVGQLSAYGATALYDGVTLGIAEVHHARGKRAVLVISDGVDQVYPGGHPLSDDTLPDAIQMALANNVEVHAIGIGDRVKHGVLERLARGTGGVYLHAPSDFELMNLLERIGFSFFGTFTITYTSPRAAEDGTIREARLLVHFQGLKGTDVYGYQIGERTVSDSVVVKRTTTYQPGTGDLQVFTTGLRDAPLALRFYLFDQYNKPVRQGITSPDGYGKLDGGGPELVKIKPGTYRLELEVPGTTLRYVHAGVSIAGGVTKQMVIRYAKLAFRRNGKTWYDTQHPFGDTSELITLKLVNAVDGRVCHAGRLVDFKEGRETSLWIEEGRYRLELGNVWHQAQPPELEKVALRNRLEAEIASLGGRILYFDVSDEDLVIERDPLLAARAPDLRRPRTTDLDIAPDRPGERRSVGYRPEEEAQLSSERFTPQPAVETPPVTGVSSSSPSLPGTLPAPPAPGGETLPPAGEGPATSPAAPQPQPSAAPATTEISMRPRGDARGYSYRHDGEGAKRTLAVSVPAPALPPVRLAPPPEPVAAPLPRLAKLVERDPSLAPMPEAAPLAGVPDPDDGRPRRGARRGPRATGPDEPSHEELARMPARRGKLLKLAKLAGEPVESEPDGPREAWRTGAPDLEAQERRAMLGDGPGEPAVAAAVAATSSPDAEMAAKPAKRRARGKAKKDPRAADAALAKASRGKAPVSRPAAPVEPVVAATTPVKAAEPSKPEPVDAPSLISPKDALSRVELPGFEAPVETAASAPKPAGRAAPVAGAPASRGRTAPSKRADAGGDKLVSRLAALAGTVDAADTRGKLESLARSMERSSARAASPQGTLEPRAVTTASRGLAPDGVIGSQVVGVQPRAADRRGKSVKEATPGSEVDARRAPSRAGSGPDAPKKGKVYLGDALSELKAMVTPAEPGELRAPAPSPSRGAKKKQRASRESWFPAPKASPGPAPAMIASPYIKIIRRAGP